MLDKTIATKLQKGEIEFIDLRFTDLRGAWQHMSIPAHEFTEENITQGFGFDGSSIRGFSTIFESDMLLKPDMQTIFTDPFFEKTAVCICEVYDPDTGKNFEKDPRFIAKKAENYLKKNGIADISYWGPEIEFFVFDICSYYVSPTKSYINIVNDEIPTPDNEEMISDGHKILNKLGYFPTPPFDKLQAFRGEMVKMLEAMNIQVEVHHHEVATGGQCEIDMRYDSLVNMADKVMKYKYVARNLAQKYGMVANFMPKPIYGDNGSGMHTHQSLFKKGKNLFYDPKGYAEFSQFGLSYIGGLLTHLPSVLAISNPTVNSYRRLVPHFEAPTSIAFSKRNRSAAIRIPMYFKNQENTKRLEFRVPDPTCNPYLAFSAELVYGIDGIQKKLDPKKLGFGPFEENIWEKKNIRQTPHTLFEVLENLKKDTVLVKSGVFNKNILESYISVKEEEMQQNLLYPTPADFWYYSDI